MIFRCPNIQIFNNYRLVLLRFLLQNVPVILGCCAVMECKAHSVHTVGDHHVWYGEVQDAHVDDKISHPMLYHYRYCIQSLFGCR